MIDTTVAIPALACSMTTAGQQLALDALRAEQNAFDDTLSGWRSPHRNDAPLPGGRAAELARDELIALRACRAQWASDYAQLQASFDALAGVNSRLRADIATLLLERDGWRARVAELGGAY